MATLTRDQMDELLVDYLYDELDAERREEFEAALVDHPDLRAEVAEHRQTRTLMSKLEDEPVRQPVLDDILREARKAASPDEAPGGLLSKLLALFTQPAFATAAAFVVVAGIAFVLVQARDTGPQGDAAKPPTVAKAPETRLKAPAEPAATAVASADEVATEEPVEAAGAEALAEAGASAEAERPEVAPSAPSAPIEVADNKPVRRRGKRATKSKKLAKPAAPANPEPVLDVAGVTKSTGDGMRQVYDANLAEGGEGKNAEADKTAPLEVAAAAAPRTRSLKEAPAPAPKTSGSSGHGASTHPATDDKAQATPADTAQRLRKEVADAVRNGDFAKARKALDELEKVPGTRSEVTELRKELAKAEQEARELAKRKARRAAEKKVKSDKAGAEKPAEDKASTY